MSNRPPFLRRMMAAALIALTGLLPPLAPAVLAQQSLIVGNDRGGAVGARIREIARLRQSGQRVEIRGNICYSTCTMYLGTDNLCISPATTFGFHGPSRSGQPLSPDQFEVWSRLMADYYKPPLHDWFLAQGRYVISDIYRFTGRDLIRLGYPTC